MAQRRTGSITVRMPSPFAGLTTPNARIGVVRMKSRQMPSLPLPFHGTSGGVSAVVRSLRADFRSMAADRMVV
jgi:hypothetical protein